MTFLQVTYVFEEELYKIKVFQTKCCKVLTKLCLYIIIIIMLNLYFKNVDDFYRQRNLEK